MTYPVIADTYGPLPLPAVAPATRTPDGVNNSPTVAAGDVVLTKTADYLAACLNAYGQAAWGAVAPASPAKASAIVNRAFTHDPDQATFSEAYLPALFVWRVGSFDVPTWVADDYRVSNDTIRVLWIPPPAPQDNATRRGPVNNVIAKVIDEAIERTRMPAWIDPGDTDPDATHRGSLYAFRAGLWSVKVAKTLVVPIAIEMADGAPPRKYQTVAIDLAIQELMARGGYPANAGVTGTITSPANDSPSPIVTDQFTFP